MKSRTLALLFTLVLCLTALVGCNKQKTTTKPKPSSTSSTSTTTTLPAPDLTCYHTGNVNTPTCEEAVACSVCGETIDALGHFYVMPGVHTKGDCERAGFVTYDCLRCDASYDINDSYLEPHTYENGACAVCALPEGKVKIEPTKADTVVLPDKYNTGAGSLGYEDETIVKVTGAGVYNGITVTGNTGGYRVSLSGLDPVNDKIVISNLDFSEGTFVGVANYTPTQKTTVYFVNCIFQKIQTNRNGEDSHMYLHFDHCTVKNFGGSNVTLEWCEFGGNDDVDAMNPFQNVTVKNCYVANKDAVGYDRELHADATQIYGYGPNGKETVAKNQYYYNFRAEMPSVWYTDSKSYTNSILMISLDYNDADNITFEHCTINGGGCPIMLFDNPKNKNPGFKMTNIHYKDIYHGCVKQFGERVMTLTSPESSVTLENVVPTKTLLVGSVWKEDGKTHFSVTNDTNETRQFTVMTDKGTYSFTVEGCPLFVELERDQAFSEFPFDLQYSIDEDAQWAVCYDSTNGNYQQIRFYNPEESEVYLDEGRLESWAPATELYEIDHGRMGDDLYWILMSDGTLTLSPTNNRQGAGNRSSTVNTPRKDYKAYKDIIRAIVVEPGITSVGKSMFAGYQALESVTLPSTIKTIGMFAFENCHHQP